MEQLSELFLNLKKETFVPSKSDVLLNIQGNKNLVLLNVESMVSEDGSFSLPFNQSLDKLIKKSNQFEKQFGLSTLGYTATCVKFLFDHKEYYVPFEIIPVIGKLDRFSNVFHFQKANESYVNPLLLNICNISSENSNLEEVKSKVLDTVTNVEIINERYLGNFHHHRFVLQKELEEIEPIAEDSVGIKQLFLGEQPDEFVLDLPDVTLFDFDQPQQEAYKSLKEKNISLEGPPGTGKSNLIANLLGAMMATGQKGVLITEKPIALKVIYDSFKSVGLHHYCLLDHQGNNNKDFVEQLKSTWRIIEQPKLKTRQHLSVSSLLFDQFQQLLDKLNDNHLVGGLSYCQFIGKYKSALDSKFKSSQFDFEPPELTDWENEKHNVSLLLKNAAELPDVWKYIAYHKSKDFFIDFKTNFDAFASRVDILSLHGFNQQAFYDHHYRIASYIHLLYFDGKRIPLSLVQDERKYKKFKKYFNHLCDLTDEINLLKEEKQHWKKDLSLSELTEFIEVLGKNSKFNPFIQYQKKQILKFANINQSAAALSLKRIKQLKDLELEKVKLQTYFRKQDLPIEIEELRQINLLYQKLKNLDSNIVKSLFALSDEEIIDYYNKQGSYFEIHHFFKHFYTKDDRCFGDIVLQMKAVFSFIRINLESLQKLSYSTLKVLRSGGALEQMTNYVVNYHWQKLASRYPTLINISGDVFVEKLEKIKQEIAQEQNNLKETIPYQISLKFQSYHEVMQTPARQLDEANKLLKKKLVKGKAILTKAFSKKRVFPSPYELINSDASVWINLMFPAVLCSPYSLAKHYGYEANQLDLVIFDEASQLPLAHAIGGVFRAKRILVAGDQQQMSPKAYFSSAQYDSNLLHQSSFYFDKIMLTNHYRCKHNELISFSNQFYYNNRLKTYPAKKEVSPIEVINLQGVYKDRINQIEAEKVAEIIKEKITKKELDFGVVAFSQIQLEAILAHFTQDELHVLENCETIFTYPLEQVQGEECGHLIISLGYSYDEEGRFLMRFGPLNENDGHKRLNVLMSRAKEKITFVRSVYAKDFKFSNNLGVHQLKQLMLYLEKEKSNEDLVLPNSLEFRKHGDELIIYNVHEKLDTALSVYTLYVMLQNRGWQVKFEIV